MQKDLTERNKREIEALTKKYEAMLEELRRQAGSDKEFIQNELRKKIAELEAQIEELRSKFAEEKEEMMNA